jgi:HD-GYP domain-containing protein (c-di-GMP phosphodiesterase class II)
MGVGALFFGGRPDARTHGQAVGRLAASAAIALGFGEHVAGRIGLAGTLHDVGEQLISEEVLNAPGPLSADHWAQIRLHPVLGEQMLLGEGLTDIAPWVRSHHERPDGLGYPDGLRGEEIPVEARLLAAADAYDAITSERRHLPALSPREAREELAICAGKQFDREVLAAVLRCTDDEVGARRAQPTRLAVITHTRSPAVRSKTQDPASV